MPSPAKAYAAQSATTPLCSLRASSAATRCPTTSRSTSSIAGSAIRTCTPCAARWGGTLYPSVPGHEIVGRVTAVGGDVTRFAVGDLVGVGCMVDSCGHCPSCHAGEEQFCETTGFVGTYNGEDKVARRAHVRRLFGPYRRQATIFVARIRHDEKDLAAVAPLLCAGITTYSPLRHWNVGPGKKVGVVGIGGLGHMGIKLAAAMGAHVVAFTTSPDKIEDAQKLGAHEVVVSQ